MLTTDLKMQYALSDIDFTIQVQSTNAFIENNTPA